MHVVCKGEIDIKTALLTVFQIGRAILSFYCASEFVQQAKNTDVLFGELLPLAAGEDFLLLRFCVAAVEQVGQIRARKGIFCDFGKELREYLRTGSAQMIAVIVSA